MMAGFKRKFHVLIIVRNIRFVMHHQEFEEGHIRYLLSVLNIVSHKQRKAKYLMKLCGSQQIEG